jgi:hypothetical protein
MIDFHILREIDHSSVEVNKDSYLLALNIECISLLTYNHQFFVQFRLNFQIIKRGNLFSAVLLEEDEIRVGVSLFSEKISKHLCVFLIHPMLATRNNSTIFCCEFAVLTAKIFLPFNVLLGYFVPIVWSILFSALDRKCDIARIEQFSIVGVAGHHGSSCKQIRHYRTQMIDPVSSRRVPTYEDLVGVD